jgi:uroporphyrinogen-III synthase
MPHPVIRILSTRPLATTLIDEGAARGIVIDALPFIKTGPVTGETLALPIKELSTQPLTAVFTSMNAVDAVTAHLEGLPIPPWDIFCISAATRRRVRDYFGEEHIAGTADDASALAGTLIRSISTKKTNSEVFFFCGDQRRDELPDRLRQASIKINEIIVYHTLPTPHTIQTAYDGIIFFSPSAVQSFFSVNTIPASTLLFAIGATTAAAIKTQSPNKIIVGVTPDKETLVRQAIDYFQTDNIYY